MRGHLASIPKMNDQGQVPDDGLAKPIQIDLFQNLEETIAEKLRRLDIARMTPLEALNMLNELQQTNKNRAQLIPCTRKDH